jgi:hypothetical protein
MEEEAIQCVLGMSLHTTVRQLFASGWEVWRLDIIPGNGFGISIGNKGL